MKFIHWTFNITSKSSYFLTTAFSGKHTFCHSPSGLCASSTPPPPPPLV